MDQVSTAQNSRRPGASQALTEWVRELHLHEDSTILRLNAGAHPEAVLGKFSHDHLIHEHSRYVVRMATGHSLGRLATEPRLRAAMLKTAPFWNDIPWQTLLVEVVGRFKDVDPAVKIFLEETAGSAPRGNLSKNADAQWIAYLALLATNPNYRPPSQRDVEGWLGIVVRE